MRPIFSKRRREPLHFRKIVAPTSWCVSFPLLEVFIKENPVRVPVAVSSVQQASKLVPTAPEHLKPRKEVVAVMLNIEKAYDGSVEARTST